MHGRTSNGGVDVDLDGATWQGEGLDVETSNGGMRLRVPEQYSARLEAGTVNGGISVDLPITLQGRIDREISTNLGAGGPLLGVHTHNGGVARREEVATERRADVRGEARTSGPDVMSRRLQRKTVQSRPKARLHPEQRTTDDRPARPRDCDHDHDQRECEEDQRGAVLARGIGCLADPRRPMCASAIATIIPKGCSMAQKRRPVLAIAPPMSRIPSLVIGLNAKYSTSPISSCRSSKPMKAAPSRSSARLHGRPARTADNGSGNGQQPDQQNKPAQPGVGVQRSVVHGATTVHRTSALDPSTRTGV